MRVNLGCGYDYHPGWLNVDIAKNVVCDLVWDINMKPLPEKHEYIWMDNVLEHLDQNRCYQNLYDSLKGYGVVEGRVPHTLGRESTQEVTHVAHFNSTAFHNSRIITDLFHIELAETHYRLLGLNFSLPMWAVKAHEKLLPGVFPPTYIQFRLRKRYDETRCYY